MLVPDHELNRYANACCHPNDGNLASMPEESVATRHVQRQRYRYCGYVSHKITNPDNTFRGNSQHDCQQIEEGRHIYFAKKYLEDYTRNAGFVMRTIYAIVMALHIHFMITMYVKEEIFSRASTGRESRPSSTSSARRDSATSSTSGATLRRAGSTSPTNRARRMRARSSATFSTASSPATSTQSMWFTRSFFPRSRLRRRQCRSCP